MTTDHVSVVGLKPTTERRAKLLDSIEQLAALLIAAFALAGCGLAVKSDPTDGGGYLSRLVLAPGDEAAPLGEFPTPTVEAGPPPCIATVTADVLNVRADPLLWSTVRAQLHRGDQVEVINRAPGWLEIATPSGWISAGYARADCLE